MKALILIICFVIAVTSSSSERIADQKCKEYRPTATKEDSVLKKFPHMVLLMNNDDPSIRCYGALISESYVLTTGFCLKAPKPLQSVLLGSQHSEKRTDGYRIVNIVKTIPHPEYSHASHLNDIGLVKIEPISTFTETIRPACLFTGVVNDDQILEDAVWEGDDKHGLANFKTKIVPYSQCKSRYTMKNFVLEADLHICGYPKESERQRNIGGVTHVSDNGQWKIAALDSFGPGVVTAAHPEVYTRISPHLDWIENTVWG